MPVKLHFEILGTGKPVMILHGLFGSARNWQGIARQLAEHYRLIMVDLRNHGNSAHAAHMSYPDMAADIEACVRENRFAPLTVIGHSMGGKTAMTFALLYPDLADKIIIMDIAPVSYVRGYDTLVDTMLALPLNTINTRNEANRFLERDIADPGLRTFLLQNLVRKGDRYQWRINLSAIKENLANIGGFPAFTPEQQYRKPALFIGGTEADYLLPEHYPAIHALFPAARIETIAGAGHWLHADKPQQVIEHIHSFLGN